MGRSYFQILDEGLLVGQAAVFGVRYLRKERYYANACIVPMKYVTPEAPGE